MRKLFTLFVLAFMISVVTYSNDSDGWNNPQLNVWGATINDKSPNELPIDIALGDYVKFFIWTNLTKQGIPLEEAYFRLDQVINGAVVNTWIEPGEDLGTNNSDCNAIAPNEAALTAPGPSKPITFTCVSQDSEGNDLPEGSGSFTFYLCKTSDNSIVKTVVLPVTFTEKVRDYKGGSSDMSIHGTGRPFEKIYENESPLVTPWIHNPQAPLDFYEWSYAEFYSDEFEGEEVDVDKWDNKLPDWGTTPAWIFTDEHTSVEDGNLILEVNDYPKYSDQGRELYFKSGAVRSWEVVTYGFFEARIKSTDLIPGTCPAFWMYSKGPWGDEPFGHADSRVQYCEIDGIEIGQTFQDKKRVLRTFEMNLHTYHLKSNGQWGWTRGVSGGDVTHGRWISDDLNFDIRDDYHTIGIWNRSDSIFWYVDGELRNAKKNLYWHLPMRVIVSLGIRPPYVKTQGGGFTSVDPTTVGGYSESLFPDTMKVDYIRAWKILPQIVPDNNINLDYLSTNSDIIFKGRFNAGSGHLVKSEQGIKLELVEKNSSNKVVKIHKVKYDPSAKNKELGRIDMRISTNDVNELQKDGNYYALRVSFESTYHDNTIVMIGGDNDGTITGIENLSQDLRSGEFFVFPNPVTNVMKLQNVRPGTAVKLFNLQGKLLIYKTYERQGIDVSGISNGVYIVKIDNQIQKVIVKNK